MLQLHARIIHNYCFTDPSGLLSLSKHIMDANPDQPTALVYHHCIICHRLYKERKYLPFSHSYCEECLVKAEKKPNSTRIVCEKTSTSLSASVTIPACRQVGKEVELTTTTKDDKHHLHCNRSGELTTLAKPRPEDIITAELKDKQDDSNTASFVPTQCEVFVLTGGKTLSNTLQAYLPTTLKPSKIIDSDSNVGYPWGIAFGKDSVWAVVSHYGHYVCIFDDQDQLTRKFGSKGNENSHFCYPRGSAFDLNNNLYVVDEKNHRVQKFNTNGEYLMHFGHKGSGESQLQYPVGITVHNDKVFVADQINNRISVFQCNGEFSHTFGSGHLRYPYDVTVTNNNQVLVADYGHGCISIFTIDGYNVNKIGTQGSGRGQLEHPCGLCVDLHGFILITEFSHHRISIFDKDGVFVKCFGSAGSSAGQFSSPTGIACSPNGSVYVCDCDNNRIQVFSDY